MENKVIVVGNDDNNCFKHFEPEYQIENYTLSNDIHNDIAFIKSSKAKFLVVLLEIPCAKATTLYGGLEFIIWLRINAIKLPIVALSFQPLQDILKNTVYANIFSDKGTYYYHYPREFDKEEIFRKIETVSSINSIKKSLANCFDIAHFRHAYANIWGLHRLLNTFNLIFPDNKFSCTEMVNESELGLDYHIARFYYAQQENKNNFIINKIKEKFEKLKQKKDFRIIFIDDKANTGWLSFLNHLFDESVEIISIDIPNYSKDEVLRLFRNNFKNDPFLFKMFKINQNEYLDSQIENIIQNEKEYPKIWSLVNTKHLNDIIFNTNCERSIDLIISDLRLFPSDQEEHNYQNLVSMQVMRSIFKNDKFKKIKYILFTASNQILNFKYLFNYNQFSPSDIFIKEGFDIQYSADQKYINLDHLLTSLLRATTQSYRNKTTILGKSDLSSDRKIEAFEKYINSKELDSDFNSIKTFTESFSHIFLDTNLYLEDKPILALKCQNQIMTYPVAKELEKFMDKDGSEEFNAYISRYFIEQLQSTIRLDKDSLTDDECEAIDAAFKKKNSFQIADKYFQRTIEHYSNKKENKILFVTNDVKDSGNQKSTIYEIIKWAKDNQIQNLTICSFFQNKFQIFYPTDNN